MATVLDKPNPKWVEMLAAQRALLVPLGFICLLAVILVPIPPMLMDVLIALNICIAAIMLLTTMYLDSPLEFSVFPSVLLGTTMFRLVLNIASTRLILSADATTPAEATNAAGRVIGAFGSFVAAGELVVGVIMFLILVIVQFIVITKGATRISEVAARFTLDAMPGKQMAIDADLNAGVIDEKEARTRRDKISREADFFGAMDGASKFVRGDAIAGIIITAINVIGGFAIGAATKGWTMAETARVFTILTIGDGLASQIPSFVIALAAAFIVARSGAENSLGLDVANQFVARPIALTITAVFVFVLALTPLPFAPLAGIAGVLAALAFFSTKQARQTKRAIEQQAIAEAKAEAAPPTPPVEDLLKVDTMELEVGFGLVGLVDKGQGGDLLDRISAVRRQLAADTGLVLPPVRIRDNMQLGPNQYRVKIRGCAVAEGDLRPGLLLAMDSGVVTGAIEGEETIEPAFGLRAWWINPNLKQRAETMNYTVVDPTSVLTTHLAEVAKHHGDELVTREEVNNLLVQLKERSPKLVEDTVPGVITAGELQKVLQRLLKERVPIRDLETILETLGDWAGKTKDIDVLTEYARNALRRSICQQYATPSEEGNGKLRLVCVTLDPAFEDVISAYIDRSGAGTTLTMPANIANAVATRVHQALEPVLNAGHLPVVLCSPQVRAQVREIVEPHVPNLAVLSYNEVVPGIEVENLGLVTTPEDAQVAA
ncbi:MAG: flagellar biosynthesis protein FlhA [Planctomycetota bacterium]